jgi:hypothetical protein
MTILLLVVVVMMMMTKRKLYNHLDVVIQSTSNVIRNKNMFGTFPSSGLPLQNFRVKQPKKVFLDCLMNRGTARL